jgi:CheY-like chemotaxis protein
MNTSKSIVLIDDDEDEVFFFLRALESFGIRNPVTVLPHTVELKAYLQAQGEYSDRQRFLMPDLLLLDLDSRFEPVESFLQWLRQESPCPSLLAIGLSDTENKRRVQQLFDLGLNGFFLKRIRIHETVESLKELEFLADILEIQDQSDSQAG